MSRRRPCLIWKSSVKLVGGAYVGSRISETWKCISILSFILLAPIYSLL
jgi:hypothetical protein